MKILILLSARYPYPGESFLVAEIPVLSLNFDKVLIAPMSEVASGELENILPQNVSLVQLEKYRNLYVKFAKFVFWSITSPVFYFGISSLILRSFKRNGFKNGLRDLVFISYAQFRAEDLWKKLLPEVSDASSVVIYSYWAHITAAVGIALKNNLKMTNSAVITRVHGYDLWEQVNPSGFIPCREYLFEKLNFISSVSAAGLEHLKTKYPEYQSKFRLNRLGVIANSNDKREMPQKLEIVSCSNFVALKRIPLMIDALGLLNDRGVDFHWSHIGLGTTEQTRAIMAYASAKLPESTFSFVGRLPNVEVLKWYKTNPVTAFLNVSESEGVPVSAMEALSSGIPIILSDAGGNHELFDFETEMFDGRLAANPSPEQIAGILEKIGSLEQKEFEKYSSAALLTWEKNWNAQSNYSKFARELSNLTD